MGIVHYINTCLLQRWDWWWGWRSTGYRWSCIRLVRKHGLGQETVPISRP